MPLRDLRPQAKRRSATKWLEHMQGFSLDLKFSAGIWFFAKGGIRFHDAYGPPLTIAERLDIAAKLAGYGLAGMEAHYPNEINEDNLDLWKQFTKDTGLRVVTIVPNLFYQTEWKWGSLSNPNPKIRQKAIERTTRTLELNKELETDFAVVWPGGDGYENHFGLDMMAARDRFAQGLAEAMDAVPGVRVAEEPKPYEPRGHILYGTTPEGLLLGMKVEGLLQHPENRRLLQEGHALCCMNPEVGHMLMAYEDMPYAFSLVLEYGRLAHTHWNSQPLGNYDQDLNVGVLNLGAVDAALYALKMHGYQGYFGLDINPERMPVEQALRNSMDALQVANDRINEMDHEKVLWSTMHPDKGAGWLEAYLIRQRAPSASELPPLPELAME